MTTIYRYTSWTIPEAIRAEVTAWVLAADSQATLITTQLGDQLDYTVSIRDLNMLDRGHVTDKGREFAELFPQAVPCE